MKIGIIKEQNDKRVALVPAGIPKLKPLGLDVLIEKDAGLASFFSNEDYKEADGAIVSRPELLKEADIVVSIHPLSDADLKSVKEDAVVIAEFAPFANPEVEEKLKAFKIRPFSMDMIPRTTLAQSMDVLSSMASIAGYRAVLVAASKLPRYFPMMITAAGSLRPAKVLILGAGVAGLQAIATARRLGSMVEASDVRLAAKEEVQSLGAKFVEVEGAADDKDAGGYAVAQSEEFLARQRAEVQKRAAKSDVIITTAQVRGRKAPILLPKETVEQMKAGSVIVDLAASTGGNCELTKDNEIYEHKGVTIIGDSYLANGMSQDASVSYSNNVINYLKILVKDGALTLDMENEIISGSFIG